jgi:hypothetical protein
MHGNAPLPAHDGAERSPVGLEHRPHANAAVADPRVQAEQMADQPTTKWRRKNRRDRRAHAARTEVIEIGECCSATYYPERMSGPAITGAQRKR